MSKSTKEKIMPDIDNKNHWLAILIALTLGLALIILLVRKVASS